MPYFITIYIHPMKANIPHAFSKKLFSLTLNIRRAIKFCIA
ncbi:hypothetical protein [Helicobacter japonicus]|nr:hypothetical protein [Helicobacter japonicus]